jgi:hypothetical protein
MRGKARWFVPALLLVVGLSAGCSAVSKMPPAADDRAKNLAPTEGKALVYVVRPAMVGLAIGMPVTCDGKDLGKTGGGRFIYAMIDSGSHAFVSRAENTSELTLVTEAGKTYYLEQQVKMGLLKARNKLVQLNDADGKAKLLKCSLSSETAAEPATPAPADK